MEGHAIVLRRRATVPQLFHSNVLIILSNGSKTRVGSTTAEWEHFGDWKRIDDEGEKGSTSLVDHA